MKYRHCHWKYGDSKDNSERIGRLVSATVTVRNFEQMDFVRGQITRIHFAYLNIVFKRTRLKPWPRRRASIKLCFLKQGLDTIGRGCAKLFHCTACRNESQTIGAVTKNRLRRNNPRANSDSYELEVACTYHFSIFHPV